MALDSRPQNPWLYSGNKNLKDLGRSLFRKSNVSSLSLKDHLPGLHEAPPSTAPARERTRPLRPERLLRPVQLVRPRLGMKSIERNLQPICLCECFSKKLVSWGGSSFENTFPLWLVDYSAWEAFEVPFDFKPQTTDYKVYITHQLPGFWFKKKTCFSPKLDSSWKPLLL